VRCAASRAQLDTGARCAAGRVVADRVVADRVVADRIEIDFGDDGSVEDTAAAFRFMRFPKLCDMATTRGT
tara:strand:- start:921 stop:1133 length:213 start_codon:yes stop_codon:yes gene_type:complete